MKRPVFLFVALCLVVGVASAVNFTEWVAYGDAWTAHNDTHTLVMWNATGAHTWIPDGNATVVDSLVIAGGGGGSSGGGGAGGLITNTSYQVASGTTISISIGAGGNGGIANSTSGTQGGNTSFGNITANITAVGGGYGPKQDAGGIAGGSGSGAGGSGSGPRAGGSGTSGQGNAGGSSGIAVSPYPAGGGGGAGGVGSAGSAAAIAAGGIGLPVSITGTATTYAVGGWGQSAGNATPPSGQPPLAYGNGGNGAGSGVSGTVGISGVVIIKYLTSPDSDPISASFTSSSNPSTVNTAVSFTDTSTGTPTTWNWTIDGSITNTTQNAAYIFSTVGTHTIDLNVTNSTGSFSNITKTQTVVNASGFTQQDLWQTGHYTKTIHITDSATNAPIPVVVVTDSNGQSYTTTNGTAFFTEDAGAVVFYFAATGYVSKSASFIIDGDSTDTVQMVLVDTNQPVYNVYPPKDVKFHITSFFGAPIQNANVTIQGITTSTGNWDWLITLLGISLDEVAINGTAMSESTDSNGDAVFLMVPSIKYNITVSAPGYTFPNTIIAPQANQYPISANWNESWFSSGNDTLKDVNVSVSWVKYNDTYSFVNITYDDQTGATTGGAITVYRDATTRIANDTAISTMDITGTSCSNSTLVNTPTGGSSYRVLVNATTTDENIVRTFTHYFKGSPVMLPGFTSETILWLALFVVIFTAAFAGATHSPQMSVVLCVESWVFWAIGWLDYLMSWFGYGEIAVIGILTLASFIVVLWNITEGKAKGKRSS